MKEVLLTKRIKARSLMKYVFIGYFAIFYPFIQLAAFFSESDAVSFTWNEEPLYGWEAILSAPLFGIMMAGMLTLMTWAALGVGIRLYAKFSIVSISYFPVTNNDDL